MKLSDQIDHVMFSPHAKFDDYSSRCFLTVTSSHLHIFKAYFAANLINKFS